MTAVALPEERPLLLSRIRRSIRAMNAAGQACIIAVTGANGTGKTTIANWMVRDLELDQVFNLSAVSKTLQVARPDLASTAFDNFSDPTATEVFERVTTWAIGRYQEDGVNAVVEGVQVSPVVAAHPGLLTAVALIGRPSAMAGDGVRRRHFLRPDAPALATDVGTYPASHFKVVNVGEGLAVSYDAVLEIVAHSVAIASSDGRAS
jgi:hypothetical protein